MSEAVVEPTGGAGVVHDWSRDKQVFGVPWGKAMMWIFLLSDTFIFSCFLVGYMMVRISTTDPWPNPSEVFGLSVMGQSVPLLLIAIMTFVLITSSGTMALAVNMGYRKDRKKTFWLMVATAVLGATFVGMQAFEWTKLISEGVRPWENPFGAAQFGSSFFISGCETVTTRSVAATTKLLRSQASTGTSSTSSGYSSLHFSISGRGRPYGC
jgi:cytochrome c oxidase subunit 3